jgi:ABC-2 type transport system ATP-binding protein
MEILKIDNVSKSFNSATAVSGLSLSVEPGIICGLLGPNGAGKTTTIRMALNIIAPDEGEITLMGERSSEATKDKIGFLPEERGLYQKMIVEDVLAFMAEIKGIRRRDSKSLIDSWLDRMGLLETKGRRVETLSKGMQQKLQFITVLIHRPKLIILDEPFSGLDPVNAELIKDIILEEKRNGSTIILSTHVMEQAEKLCDTICLINRGRKALDGQLFDVKARFGRNTVIAEIDGDARQFASVAGVERVSDFNKYAEFKLSAGADPQVLLRELVAKSNVRRFEIVEPSLHGIFVEIVRDSEKTTIHA